MFSLVIGILWGLTLAGLAFTDRIDGFPIKLAVVLAGAGLVLKSILIYTLSAGV